jgi:hypothetical protein
MYNIPYGTDYTRQIPASFNNGAPVMIRQSATTVLNSNTTFYNGNTQVPYSFTNATYTQTTFFQRVRTNVYLTNHHFQNAVSCMMADVAGQYSLSLTVSDGCATWTATGATTANCIAQAASASWAITPASTGQTVSSTSGTAAVAVDGTQYDRITVRATVNPNNDVLTYYWRIRAMTSNVTSVPMNAEGTMVSFVAAVLTWWAR